MMTTIRMMAAVLAVAFAAPAVQAQTSAPTTAPADQELSRLKYVDLTHGFTLHPPIDTIRERLTTGTQIVGWTRRDAKTAAIVWTLTVQRAAEGKQAVEMKAYSLKVLDKLAAEGFKKDDVKLYDIDGRASFDIQGISGTDKVKFFQRQVWIQNLPGQFLILVISGPPDQRAALDKTLTAVIGTIKIVDPKQAAKQREENLGRGKELLAGLDAKKLAAAIQKEPRYFLLKIKGKDGKLADAGYMVQEESAATRDNVEGFEIKSWVYAKMDMTIVKKRIMFISGDGSTEQWSESATVTDGGKTLKLVEEGSFQDGQVACKVTDAAGKAANQTLKAPKEYYISHAVDLMLPRLVDLKKPATYSFMGYDSQGAGRLDTRTLSVEEGEKITIGDKAIDCIRTTQQTSLDAEPATLYVDDKGGVVRMTTADGLLLETATLDEVAKLFPGVKNVKNE